MKYKVLLIMTESTAEHLENLREIRSMMEKSSRFISLSGLSGVIAGIYALAGAAIAFWYLDMNLYGRIPKSYFHHQYEFNLFFFTDAIIVLVLAISTGIIFTTRQAKKNGQKIWDATSRRLLINTAIPLIAGGGYCLALVYYQIVGLIAPATLIFYGLALINGSKYTLEDIRYLGYCEIALGLIATMFIGYGLFFWAFGFGILHILYGTIMYFKYEK